MKKTISFGLLIMAALLSGLYNCSKGEVKMEVNPVNLSDYIGKIVTLKGKESAMPWQHMIDQVPGYPYMMYLDWEGDQTVVYSRKPIDCGDTLLITGKVIRIEGQSKRPGSTEKYTEIQLVADDIRCIKERVEVEARDPETLAPYAGKVVELNGEVTGIMWQHIMGFFSAYPYENYLDWKDSQIVFYTSRVYECKGQTKITGKVVEVIGKGKDDTPGVEHTEYHILADRVECDE